MNRLSAKNTHGFTLLELMISIAVLAIICVLGVVALQSSANAMSAAASKSEVQGNLRDALTAMQRELELASKTSDDSLLPPLNEVTVNANPADRCPTEIVFQVPTDGTGLRWSQPIRFRFYNEDVDGNGVLSPGEDADGDRTLSRRLLRLEDLNGDGDTADATETRVVAGANNLSDVQFAVNDDVITVTLAAEKHLDGRRDQPVTMSVTSQVYLQN